MKWRKHISKLEDCFLSPVAKMQLGKTAALHCSRLFAQLTTHCNDDKRKFILSISLTVILFFASIFLLTVVAQFYYIYWRARKAKIPEQFVGDHFLVKPYV